MVDKKIFLIKLRPVHLYKNVHCFYFNERIHCYFLNSQLNQYGVNAHTNQKAFIEILCMRVVGYVGCVGAGLATPIKTKALA